MPPRTPKRTPLPLPLGTPVNVHPLKHVVRAVPLLAKLAPLKPLPEPVQVMDMSRFWGTYVLPPGLARRAVTVMLVTDAVPRAVVKAPQVETLTEPLEATAGGGEDITGGGLRGGGVARGGGPKAAEEGHVGKVGSGTDEKEHVPEDPAVRPMDPL